MDEVRSELQASAADLRNEMKANTESIPETVQSEIYKVLRTRTGQGPVSEEIKQHQNYLLCRRSMRLWPVRDTGGGLKAAAKMFFEETLEVEGQAVNRLGIEAVTPTQVLPRSKIKHEVLVHFFTADERDMVYSHAKNLAKHQGKAGVRLEIPQHLRPEFKLLESHGNNIRTMYGPSVKRSIRFDDAECSLILNMKLSPDDPWVTVSVDQAREARKMRSQASIALIRSTQPATQNQTMSASQGRALGLPQSVGPRPRPIIGPSASAQRPAVQARPNPFSYLNGTGTDSQEKQ